MGRYKKREPDPHGTANRYNSYGCRCRPCRTAWATYIREWKHEHKGVRSRDERRYFRGRRGRRGFDPVTEAILDAAEQHSGRSWRDIVGLYARTQGAKVRFPKAAAEDEATT